ncbi:hypothetical protein EYF80_004606 [Liparis tanakae]|uniref:Uncharacterized protein n=1 Tax=Liparis tanakae TaxID=230148 RepID=A0A4Z2J509_9TELE|nr:hypothetical protein EYF80_004606 [Liparis tanakae]
MIPTKGLKSVGPMHSERFVTSYSCDYKPFRECQLQVNQLQSSWEAAAAPASTGPPQSRGETWPVFHHYFYKTTNSIYGSTCCPQPPSCSLFPGSLHPLCTPAPYMSEAPAFVGCSPTEARTQEVGVGREIGPLLGEEMKGHLHYVFGGKANMLEQQEAKDEPQRKIDVLYEEKQHTSSGPITAHVLLHGAQQEYTADRVPSQWGQPKMQQSVIHYRHPHHKTLYSSF